MKAKGRMGKPKMVKPTPKSVYRQRVAKPEPDDVPGRPRRRTNFPKGFI